MHDFKIGDEIKEKQTGNTGVITSIDGYKLWAKWNDEDDLMWIADSDVIFIKPAKSAKTYAESDRRKAAKAVRIAEEKLSQAIRCAKESGINVSLVNINVGLINVKMSYQPATPKVRV